MRGIRTGVWLCAGVIVVLLARAIAYALEPSSSARLLEQRAGGPALPVLVLVSLALAGSVAIAICWLAAVGVRERALLERRRLAAPVPSLRAGRTLAVALALSLVTSIAGGLLEAYVHWHAGLGWHGLHCLLGPVHRDLIPLETALSFLAAAFVEAASHVISWMRRTFALFRRLPPRVVERKCVIRPTAFEVRRETLCFGAGAPRAPPACS
jgi:hypothetical protein